MTMGLLTGVIGTAGCEGGGVAIGVADLGSEIGVALGVMDLRIDSCLLDGGCGGVAGSDATSCSGVCVDQHSSGVGRLSFGGGL